MARSHTGPPPIRLETTQVYESIRGPEAERPVSSGIEFWKVLFVVLALIAMALLVALALAAG